MFVSRAINNGSVHAIPSFHVVLSAIMCDYVSSGSDVSILSLSWLLCLSLTHLSLMNVPYLSLTNVPYFSLTNILYLSLMNVTPLSLVRISYLSLMNVPLRMSPFPREYPISFPHKCHECHISPWQMSPISPWQMSLISPW